MASKGNANHKNLADAFSGAPAAERGSRLQGLLNAPAVTGQPVQTAPPAPPSNPAVGAAESTSDVQTEDVQTFSSDAAESPAGDAGARVATRTAPKRRKRVETEGRGGSASSVYLTATAYKQLTDTKRLRVKDYAQIVQDAFAQIAKEAADQKKSPDEVLADLFKVSENTDPWLMPPSTTRAKSPTPLTEARISFSAPQREWIEKRMESVDVGTFSEFIARVLEHHLLPAKTKRGK
ncbi:hypothetical protein [Mycobacteroides abscessus]